MAEERCTNTPPATAPDLNVSAQIEVDNYTDPLRRTVAVQFAPRLGGQVNVRLSASPWTRHKLAKIEECI